MVWSVRSWTFTPSASDRRTAAPEVTVSAWDEIAMSVDLRGRDGEEAGQHTEDGHHRGNPREVLKALRLQDEDGKGEQEHRLTLDAGDDGGHGVRLPQSNGAAQRRGTART